MRSPSSVKSEYRKVCQAMHDLLQKGGPRNRTPLECDEILYLRLETIKRTLEWVFPRLIKTSAKGHGRLNELLGYKHYAMGPTHDTLYP